MRIAHIDPIGGAAGNMLVAALVDAGADLERIEDALRAIVPTGWAMASSRTRRGGISARYLDVVVPGEDDRFAARTSGVASATTLRDVIARIDASGLGISQKLRASAVYQTLAAAEARVHGCSVDAVHFHEVGTIDAILDVAAFIVGCDLLGIESLSCGPLPVGTGDIVMAHGRYPNPAPATAYLTLDIPTYASPATGELVTPTAAAIIKTLCTAFGPSPAMTTDAIGYGAGTRDGELPNVTRISIGTAAAQAASFPNTVCVLESNVDDMSPQFFELAIERLFAAGALDVWLTTITMKKGRPALTISAMCAPSSEGPCAAVMLRETTTIGVRVREERRYMLSREIVSVQTKYGPVRVKEIGHNGTARMMPEYDDVIRIARECGESMLTIMRSIEMELRRP